LSTELKMGLLVLATAIFMMGAIGEDAGYSVNIANNTTVGSYLTNETGFTLYYFLNDSPGNGTSACSGGCATFWPAFYAENVTVPEGLNATDFTTINRTDGTMQTAYKGWPLYLYSKDTEAGDVYGQGVNNLWYVVNPGDFPQRPSQ
jgi:predicted lipoprotein with Yx(FWY)xxD motif